MKRSLVLLVCLLATACGNSGNSTSIDSGTSDGAKACGAGDDCNIAMNSGCDDDQRCDIVKVSSSCFEPTCVAPGLVPAGGACSLTNNEGALTWDNCGNHLVCYQGMCRTPCDSATPCATTFNCVPDSDVGSLVVSVCVPG